MLYIKLTITAYRMKYHYSTLLEGICCILTSQTMKNYSYNTLTTTANHITFLEVNLAGVLTGPGLASKGS